MSRKVDVYTGRLKPSGWEVAGGCIGLIVVLVFYFAVLAGFIVGIVELLRVLNVI